jgi:hypothetical protein
MARVVPLFGGATAAGLAGLIWGTDLPMRWVTASLLLVGGLLGLALMASLRVVVEPGSVVVSDIRGARRFLAGAAVQAQTVQFGVTSERLLQITSPSGSQRSLPMSMFSRSTADDLTKALRTALD